MAKNRNQQQRQDMGSQSQGQQGQQSQQGQQGRQQKQAGQQQRGGQLQAQDQKGQSQDLWTSVKPAFDEARQYIEGSPIRAAAIGAVAGGLLMTLFSTEKGRSFVKMAYDYANPMVAKYARDFVSQQAGNMTESALSQH